LHTIAELRATPTNRQISSRGERKRVMARAASCCFIYYSFVDLTFFFGLVSATTSFSGTLQQTFSSGNFVDCSKGVRQTRSQKSSDEHSLSEVPETAEGDAGVGVFQCPSEGCIKVYQRYSALEKHLSYEKCELLPEKATLLDQAKEMYHLKLTEGRSAGATSHDERTVPRELAANTSQLARGWALKQTKKSGRLSETQKKYLNEKFSIGQQTGHKVDPLSVARDMRYAKNAMGNRLFTRDEFLSAQQIQSYFCRQAGKLRHQHAEDDSSDREAAVDQQQYWDTRTEVLREVQLQHPITYDNLDLCALYHANRLNQLSVTVLKYICEYFDINKEQLTLRRKTPYISLIGKLVQSCSCHEQQ